MYLDNGPLKIISAVDNSLYYIIWCKNWSTNKCYRYYWQPLIQSKFIKCLVSPRLACDKKNTILVIFWLGLPLDKIFVLPKLYVYEKI